MAALGAPRQTKIRVIAMKLPKLSLVLMAILLVSFPIQHWIIEKMANESLGNAIADATQAANVTVTKLFINEVYPRLVQHLGLESGPNAMPAKGLEGVALAETDRTIRNFMFGTDIMKVKLYALNGMTIYSTELAQIGQDQSKNPSLISATQGIPGSQITHRGKFSAIEGEVFEKDLVASYIPIRNKSGIVIGVAEIYTDRTPVIEKAIGGEGYLHPFMLLTNAIQIVLILLLAWSFWTRLAQIEFEAEAGR